MYVKSPNCLATIRCSIIFQPIAFASAFGNGVFRLHTFQIGLTGGRKVISESGVTFGSRTELDHTRYLNLWIDLFLHRFLRLVLADPGATTVEYVTFSILLSFVNYNALFTYTMVLSYLYEKFTMGSY